ncbi:MAG: photosynthetic reaction center cytochrome c subunit family protein, partial [Terriglobia bacterium]
MDKLTKKVIFALTLAVAITAAAPFASAQRKAEEVYKEIKVLNGMPADQLNATMQFFEASLGVGCNFCHLEDRVTNTERKDVARKMVQMVRDINKNTFEGNTEVTCYSCHRGQTGPPENPALATAEFRPWEPDSPNGLPNAPPVAGPPPAQILDKWIASSGGMDKISKITSVVAKYTATNSVGATQQMERITKGNNSLLILGNATIARSGNTGWFRAGNGNPRDIRNYELNANRFRDPIYLAKNAKSFTQLTSRQDEIRGGVAVYQVRGVSPDGVPVRMWFSRDTGNLLRVSWFTPNAVGQNMERVDYSDFGEVDGVLVARRAVIRTPLSYQTLRVNSI